ncbi:legumain-like [Mya arenaria]|uniref:legumain-like n=1 Tax=Mya arenaria TaxID=6604 RepID=UPI0022E2161C|nr:legumain-like [Mya arenaria]
MERLFVLCCVFGLSLSLPSNVFEFEQPQNGGNHWALLVAGSNGYFNYRHQADVCHAYQILHAHGIPDERIVVMMYDDIAENSENPVKGNLINHPDGPNVYEGIIKDYTGKEVNPETFLSVLKGEKDKVNGKVIDSGPNDHVFVNFVDHGAPGILGFGSKTLKAKKLMDAIMFMHDNKKYDKLVFYVEACESGSMFEDLLPKDINVYATTASNSHESSYACYFDKTRKTYLGDVYSVKWMEDSDKEDLTQETLQKQFSITKEETNSSHVQEFGDLSIGQMTVAEFQGLQTAKRHFSEPTVKDYCADKVKSEDVPLESLRRSLNLVSSKEEAVNIQQQIEQILKEREVVNKTMKQIIAMATDDHVLTTNVMETRHKISAWDCYEEVVETADQLCDEYLNIPENDYALRKLYMFVNMCEMHVPREAINAAIEEVCNVGKVNIQ